MRLGPLGARRGWLDAFVLSMAGRMKVDWSMPHVSVTMRERRPVIAWHSAKLAYQDLGCSGLQEPRSDLP